MPRIQRRGTYNSREFSGEWSSIEVLRWLNADEDDSDRRKVRQLLRNVRFVTGDLVRDLEGTWVPRSKDAFSLARENISRLLSKYKFAPLLKPVPGMTICQWTPVSGPRGKFKRRWPPQDNKYDDVEAIYDLVTLPQGCIVRILECVCGKWFYRRFSHQRFCSGRCRDKAHKSTPESREYRRKKARDYYRLHKNKQTK